MSEARRRRARPRAASCKAAKRLRSEPQASEAGRGGGGAASRPRAKSSRPAGFTLIEIMAVVVIIGLLTTLVGGMVFRQIDKARVTTARTQINSLGAQLEIYRMDNGRFPSTEQGLDALVHEPSGEPAAHNYQQGGYLKGGKVPLDPWAEPYYYESPGQHNEHSFDLWSHGADGTPGGEGIDADIGNWSDEQS